MDTRYFNIRSFLLVHCVGVVLSASYYQREFSGYSFTTPGFNDAERRSQMDARTWCNQNGSRLLAITNQSIQTAVVAFIKDAITQNHMTGNTIITDGQRANGHWTWINETMHITLPIGGQEGGSSYSYASLFVAPAQNGFSLFAYTPTDRRYFICEGSVFCGNGYQIQGQCFQSFRNDSDLISWYEARNRCLQRGGDLATFEFITTNDGLNALNGSWLSPSSSYWIGLRREWWTWQSTNSEVTYSQWSDGHPIYYDNPAKCLCLFPNGWKWSECQCSQSYQFICISSAGTDGSAPSTKTSTSARQSVFTSTSSTTTTTQSETQDDNSCSHLGVGLGVGLGIGIPLLLIIIALVIVVIQLKRKLRKYESIASSGTRVEITSTPAYESLQNGSTTIHNSTYQQLNVTN